MAHCFHLENGTWRHPSRRQPAARRGPVSGSIHAALAATQLPSGRSIRHPACNAARPHQTILHRVLTEGLFHSFVCSLTKTKTCHFLAIFWPFQVVINGNKLKLTESAVLGVNIDNCNHSCVGLPCQHGGACEPQDQFYTCHCNLGYSGFNCKKGELTGKVLWICITD